MAKKPVRNVAAEMEPRLSAPIPPTGETTSPPWGTTTKALVATGAILLALVVLWRFRDLIQPVILALILAYLLNPLVQLAQKRLNIGRGAAVGLVFGLAILILLGSLVAVGYVAFEQTDKLFVALPNLIDNSSAWVRENVLGRTVALGPISYTLPLWDDALTPAELLQQAASALNLTPSQGGNVAAALASTTVGLLSTFFVIMFISIYVSKDSPQLWGTIAEAGRAPGYHSDVERLMRDFLRVWNAYLRGQVLLALSMFIIVSIVLTALGVNYSLALGALSGILEFLPVLGPLIATVVAALVAIFQDSNWFGIAPVWYAVLVIVVMFALQQIEGAILVPRFVGDALDLHPVIVIVVVLMGTSLAGILGAILAAPVAATIKLFGAYAWRKMFDLPPFPDPEPEDDFSSPGLWAAIKGLWSKKA
jgi:predicted PurR-regulated permease PerM